MENFNSHRQDAIAQYISSLRSKGSFTQEDLLELESHLQESMDDLQQKGLSWDESFLIAQKRLGNVEEVAIEYEKVNGPISGRIDLLYLVLGMGLFGILYGIWNIVSAFSWFLLNNKNIPLEAGPLLLMVFSLAILIVFYRIFATRDYLRKLEAKYAANPVPVGLLLLLILVSVNILLYYLSWVLGYVVDKWVTDNKESFSRFGFGYLINLSIWIVPVGVALVSSYLLFKKGERRSPATFLKEAGVVFYLFFGFGWEALCSFTRAFIQQSVPVAAVVYGMVFTIGFFYLVRLFQGKKNRELLAFILPALVIETIGGFMNFRLCIIYPVSHFVVSLVAGIVLAYGMGRYTVKKELNP